MSTTSRRGFLVAGGSLAALPAAIYRNAFGADTPPSERVRIGCIGVGGQGMGNLRHVAKHVVAVCDVDAQRRVAAAGAVAKAAGREPTADEDYRKLLDRKDVDAVLISTPDHWHALQTVHACKAGKDVYCEKPLSLTIAEGRAMVDAARKHRRVVQTGSQQRSAKEFRVACELVRNEALGKLKKVLVGLPGPNWTDRAKGPAPDSEPPADLNYDLWLGPTPKVPYNEKKVHYLFRFFWAYSGGQQTNFGAHHLDIAQWALGADASGPVSVEGKATFNKPGWFETPETANITYGYANGVSVHCTLGKGNPQGATFECERGTIHVNRGKLEVRQGGAKVDPATLAGGTVRLPVSAQHHDNWLACIKSREAPICDVEIGHRSATVCHLGNLAVRLGRKLAWDPAAEAFVGDAEAAKMLSREYRAPWKL